MKAEAMKAEAMKAFATKAFVAVDRKKWRLLLGVGLCALALALAGGWWQHWTKPPEALVLAVARNMMGVPLLIAERQGYFAAEGLRVTLRPYPFGQPAFEAMLRGEAEVATVAETPLVMASLGGRPFSVIAHYMASVGHLIVARADRGITRIEDLRGRRVGVSPGTTAHYMLHVMLSDAGLADADIQLVPLAGPQMAVALAAGSVDAVASLPPYSVAARRILGGTASVFTPGLRYAGASCLAVPRDFAQRRPQAVARLLRATERAIAWMRAHRREAIQIAVEEVGMERADIEAVWDELRPGLALDQHFILLLEAEARWAVTGGLRAPGTVLPNYLDYIDSSVLQALRPEAVTVIRGS